MNRQPVLLGLHCALVAALFLLTSVIIGIDRSLFIFPFVWVVSCFVFAFYRTGVAILIAHALVLMVSVSPLLHETPWYELPLSYGSDLEPSLQAYLLVFWYCPAIFLFLNSDLDAFAWEMSKHSIWKAPFFRQTLILVVRVLLWRDKLRLRFDQVSFQLKIRGIDTSGWLRKLTTLGHWAPKLVSSTIVEAMEVSRLEDDFHLDIRNWQAHPVAKRQTHLVHIYKLLIVVVLLAAFFTSGWPRR